MKPKWNYLLAGLKSGLMKPKHVLPIHAKLLINNHIVVSLEKVGRMDTVGAYIECAYACLIEKASLVKRSFLVRSLKNSRIVFAEEMVRNEMDLISAIAAYCLLESETLADATMMMRGELWREQNMDERMAKMFSAQLVQLMECSILDPSIQQIAGQQLEALMPVFNRMLDERKNPEGTADMREFLASSSASNCEKSVSVMASIFYTVNKFGYPLTYDEAQAIASPDYENEINNRLSDKSLEFLREIEKKLD